MCPYRNFHKYTWTDRDGKTHNQIDHVWIERKQHTSISDVRSFRRIYYDTAHSLVVAKVRERLAASKQETQKFNAERFSLRKINELEVRKEYQIKISNRFLQLWRA